MHPSALHALYFIIKGVAQHPLRHFSHQLTDITNGRQDRSPTRIYLFKPHHTFVSVSQIKNAFHRPNFGRERRFNDRYL